MTVAPTITTARLTLRHHRLEDFKPMAALFASEWAKYMGGPISDDELWRWLGAEVTSWQWLGYGSWAVDLTETGELIGQVGVNKPPRFPEVELGWCIFPGFEGQGLAFEAACAARDWAFENTALSTLVSYIDNDNARSIALAKRLGAIKDKSSARPDPADVVYRHPHPDELQGGMEAYA
ncbi:GNAT family N-acetyltransferase [Ruegeria sp. THAF57]|uniref:GNAT family N-acetyltransferase n=1 Tax=Ruegeria sp. THAF57 TaxID=2744555 RepID=UPI0015DEC3CE|nr:GNAT family N-acetyltransferase [Ruegeria sp. THAF57]